MREIKFRAWDKPKETMLKEVQSFYDGNCTDDYYQPEGYGWIESFGEILKDNDFIVMQYTGLKDKNGTEIYEGDIVRWCCPNTGWVRRPAIVEWWDTAYFPLQEGDEFEVIGNVFENLDLLEGLND